MREKKNDVQTPLYYILIIIIIFSRVKHLPYSAGPRDMSMSFFRKRIREQFSRVRNTAQTNEKKKIFPIWQSW